MRLVIIFCMLCFLVACRSPEDGSLPGKLTADSILSREQMIQVLEDVHLVEASLEMQKNRGGKIPVLSENYYNWLCSKHHMSRQRFRDNLDYYKMDPENLSRMYEEVLKNLTERAKKPGVKKTAPKKPGSKKEPSE